MKRVEDYISDIPMEIGRNFFPRPEIRMPTVVLPSSNVFKTYTFDVENQAREMYENKDINPPTIPRNEKVNTTNSLDALISTEVLQPLKIVGNTNAASKPVIATSQNLTSFEDFEVKGTFFDELEWKTIDDKTALSQVLSVSSEPSTPAPQQQTEKPITFLPSYPSLSFNTVKESQVSVASNGDVAYKANTPAVMPRPPSTSSLTNAASGSSVTSTAQLKTRLLTKGYRENLVNEALANLPKQRWVHIEYYIKGMSTLEKQGVKADASLRYLVDCGVTDKQDVLDKAQTAAQIVGMGFDADVVFKACIEKKGNKVEILNVLLPQ